MKRLKCGGCLLAAALILGGLTASPALATAGSAADPLISRSYLADTYYPEVRQTLSDAADEVIRAHFGGDVHPETRVLNLIPGESVALAAGQEFTLLSGAGSLTIEQGSVVNVTVGYEASTGVANPHSRYIVCENSSADLDITENAVARVSYRARVGTGSPFADVRRADWYYADVVNAVNRGLVNGVSASSYQPGGNLTVAQCVKLAACMHQLWQEGGVSLQAADHVPWYAPYADYALDNGILEDEPEDYDEVISRADFVGMFYRALPEEEYAEQNEVPYGAIPDIPDPEELQSGREIYAFYRAGILMGYTESATRAAFSFGPEDAITRAEVATIMNRMFDHSARRSFEIE